MFEFAAGALFHEKRYKIADPAAFEPGMLLANEGSDGHRRHLRELVDQSSHDIGEQRLFADASNAAHKYRVANGVFSLNGYLQLFACGF